MQDTHSSRWRVKIRIALASQVWMPFRTERRLMAILTNGQRPGGLVLCAGGDPAAKKFQDVKRP